MSISWGKTGITLIYIVTPTGPQYTVCVKFILFFVDSSGLISLCEGLCHYTGSFPILPRNSGTFLHRVRVSVRIHQYFPNFLTRVLWWKGLSGGEGTGEDPVTLLSILDNLDCSGDGRSLTFYLDPNSDDTETCWTYVRQTKVSEEQ